MEANWRNSRVAAAGVVNQNTWQIIVETCNGLRCAAILTAAGVNLQRENSYGPTPINIERATSRVVAIEVKKVHRRCGLVLELV